MATAARKIRKTAKEEPDPLTVRMKDEDIEWSINGKNSVFQAIQASLAVPGKSEFSNWAIAFVSNGSRLKSALRRCGYEGEVTLNLMMRAWCESGMPKEDFGRSNPRDLIRVLETKAEVLEGIRNCPDPTSPLLLKRACWLGGRKKGTFEIHGEKAFELRSSTGLSQKAFGRVVLKRVSADKVRRAEQGRATERLIEKYCACNGSNLTPALLKKQQHKPQEHP